MVADNNHDFWGGFVTGAAVVAIFALAALAGEELDRNDRDNRNPYVENISQIENEQKQCLPIGFSWCETETSKRIVDRLSRLDMIDIAKLEWCARKCVYNCYDGREWREVPE